GCQLASRLQRGDYGHPRVDLGPEVSDPRRSGRRRKALLEGLRLRLEIEHRMRDLRAVGDLDAAESVTPRDFDAISQASICADHSGAQVFGIAKAAERRSLLFNGIGLPCQLQAALVL